MFCVVITCSVSPAPAHASISTSGSEVDYNTNITYTCDLGYNRTYGDATRRCTEFETFEGTEANCTRKCLLQSLIYTVTPAIASENKCQHVNC